MAAARKNPYQTSSALGSEATRPQRLLGGRGGGVACPVGIFRSGCRCMESGDGWDNFYTVCEQRGLGWGRGA